jgi:SAM-dependent methyltransferase
MIHFQNCPVCNSKEIHEVLQVMDHTVSNEIFPVWHCQNCSLRFTQDVPLENEISRYYQSGDYISHSDIKKGVVNRLYHLVRSITIRQKKNLITRYTALNKGKILDVGCGTGSFLSTMQDESWEVIGLEPDEKARTLAIHKGLQVEPVNKLFDFEPSSFDAITLWHVLEHVHELHAYLDQLRLLLKKNGVLFIAVPNYTSSDAVHYQEGWAAYDVPRHLYHFSPASMKTLLSGHRLNMEAARPMWFDSFYVCMLSEKYKKGNIISAVFQGLLSNFLALWKKESCSSLIYIIKPA